MRIDDDILQQLSAYLDDELPPDEAGRIGKLVEAEPALREELRRLRATRELLRSLPAASPAAGFTERVVAQATAGRQAGRPVLVRLLAAAAAVLVIAGAGVIALYHGPGSRSGRDDRELASRTGDAVERGIPRESAGSRRHVEARKGAPPTADRTKAKAAPGAVAEAEKKDRVAGEESLGPAKRSPVSVGNRATEPVPDRVVIYAADLAMAVEKTKTVCRANEVRVVDSPRTASVEKKERQAAQPESVDYIVYGTDSQIEEIRRQLDSRIRAESAVSQLPENTYERLLASLDRDAGRGEVCGRLSAAAEDNVADVMIGKGGAGAAKKMPAKAAPAPRPEPAGFAGTGARRNGKNAGMTDDAKQVAAAEEKVEEREKSSKKGAFQMEASACRPETDKAKPVEEAARIAAGPRKAAETAGDGGAAAQVAVDYAAESKAVQRREEPAAPAMALKPTAVAKQKETESRPASGPAPLRSGRKKRTALKAMVITLRYRPPVPLTEAQKARFKHLEARLMNRAAAEASVEANRAAAGSEAKE